MGLGPSLRRLLGSLDSLLLLDSLRSSGLLCGLLGLRIADHLQVHSTDVLGRRLLALSGEGGNDLLELLLLGGRHLVWQRWGSLRRPHLLLHLHRHAGGHTAHRGSLRSLRLLDSLSLGLGLRSLLGGLGSLQLCLGLGELLLLLLSLNLLRRSMDHG